MLSVRIVSILKVMNVTLFWSVILILFFCSCNQENQPLFILTDSDETGFYFVNELNETKDINIFTYLNLYNGSGVAIGDINNDGLPDVFMGGNLFGGRLYLNKGDFKFQQISENANVFHSGFTTGVTMADVNADGYLDIYLCRSLQGDSSQRANLLLVNNGDLTFTERAADFGIDDKGYSMHANFFDMDNDGDLDLYVLNHRIDFENQNLIMPYHKKMVDIKNGTKKDYDAFSNHLYRNDGNNNFIDITKEAGLLNQEFSLSATISDLNNDGWLDIFHASDFADKDHLYINNGDGTFRDEIDEQFNHISRSSMGADIGDINNDGLLDLIVVDMMAPDNFRQKQLGFGQLSYNMFHLANDYGLHKQISRNCLQLNNGNGTFSEIAPLAGVSHTDWSWSPLLADFDNDGWKDLFISNGYPRDVTDVDFVKFSSDSLLQKVKQKEISNFDLAKSISSTPIQNYIFQNSKELSFSNKSDEWGLTEKTFSNGAAYADLDLDGDLDLIVNNFNEPALLYKNTSRERGVANNFISISIKGTTKNPYGWGTKVWLETEDGIQFQELTSNRGFLSTSESKMHFGLGNNSNIEKIKILYPDGKEKILKNVSVNQHLQINKKEITDFPSLELNPHKLLTETIDLTSPSYEHFESEFNDFNFEPLLPFKYSNRGPFVTVGDVNNDGLDDFFIGGSANHSGSLYLQNENEKFILKEQPVFFEDREYEDGQSLMFDFDNDGDLDLLVTSCSNEQRDNGLFKNRLYSNDGSGFFSTSSNRLPGLKYNTLCVKAIDIENDGDLDVFIGGHVKEQSFPIAYSSYLLINENGFFKVSPLTTNQEKLGIVNDATILDVNSDGLPDLLIVGEWMDITLLINTGKEFVNSTAKYGLDHTSGIWNCIELLDFDMDGDMDFVAGNRGTNSFYKVSEKTPGVLIYKDFDNNGQVDPITNYYFDDGLLYPKHSLFKLSKQLVHFNKKFPRNKKFALATTNELFTERELQNSKSKKLYTLETSLFINNNGNGFSRKALPIQSQFSSVKSILPIHINEDAKIDLLLVGNNEGVDVSIGAEDASFGVCLIGDGQSFQAIPSDISGLYAKGESQQVKLLKTKTNNNKIVVAKNSNPLTFLSLLGISGEPK